MKSKPTSSAELLDSEVDGFLHAARRTWQSGIDRDERFDRTASERRLSKKWRASTSVTPMTALVFACTVVTCTLGGIALERSRASKEGALAIRADSATLAPLQPLEEEERVATDPHSAVASSTSSSPAASVVPQPSPSVAPTTAIATPQNARLEKAVHPGDPKGLSSELPPLPPPPSVVDEPWRGVGRARGGARHTVVVGGPFGRTPPPLRGASLTNEGEGDAVRGAELEIARGDASRGRKRLWALTIHADPALAFDAAMALARSFLREGDPRRELGVWEALIARPLPEPYQSQAIKERARVVVRLGHVASSPSPTPPAPPAPPAVPGTPPTTTPTAPPTPPGLLHHTP